ncbi:hypothetical protein JIN77_10980 [Verrucomicrobiaceae bacterium R5-34]|uniref:Pseudouridine synthase RsuA/RluA-like domain-containing protein n=1 Tax=Oceaniferula flava TaxID=2800421 RepID=A0AAE2SEB9_9BACT|nr:pseudouridine synthase [Oceaniferula flavus]MBK1831253.1 hypothetical protein [Verrucomicrobiaceae bacterium R5-34]MBK1855422.1 hypothetical protein [Oceaniferula flavus]MBM1136728.1 hypothetical protein [Oceaniferula flavus]
METEIPPLPILYQDDWLIAVDKPAGHLVHPADAPQDGDLVTMKILRDQIGRKVYNVHRIDRPTTGVLLFGIDSVVAKHLHRALERHEVQKTYWAVVNGIPKQNAWECREPIQKSETQPIREAHTSFRLMSSRQPNALAGEQADTLSLIEATPHTGRYHQIRRHLEHIGLPIVGDYRYGGIDRCNRLGEQLGTGSRMLLQSQGIRFCHPISNDTISIHAPVDPSFAQCFPELA